MPRAYGSCLPARSQRHLLIDGPRQRHMGGNNDGYLADQACVKVPSDSYKLRLPLLLSMFLRRTRTVLSVPLAMMCCGSEMHLMRAGKVGRFRLTDAASPLPIHVPEIGAGSATAGRPAGRMCRSCDRRAESIDGGAGLSV